MSTFKHFLIEQKAIEDQTEEWQIDYIKSRDAEAIQLIDDPSEKVQLVAVQRDPFSIYYIKNPTEKVQLLAVSLNAYTIRSIKNPSEAVQLEAIREGNGRVVQFLENPTASAIKAALTQQGLIDDSMDYTRIVKKLFANNTILMNKWLRYGEAMRNADSDPANIVF
jgi:hypothetical protein